MDFKLLHKYFDGQTSQTEEAAIREWLAGSPENMERLINERKIYNVILINGKRNAQVAARRRSSYFRRLADVAAVAAVTFFGCWYFFSHGETDDGPVAVQTINVPAGQRINITLPDGTGVWLNAGTTIRYPVTFNKAERLVHLDGQAWFDVTKNENAPFMVKSPKGTVQALGTKFDVLDYSSGDVFETMLMEGSVRVDLAEGGQSLVLSPDRKAFRNKSDGRLQTAMVDDLSAYQWKEGLISFRNETFGNIMKLFEKTFDVKIVIRNKRVNDLVLTGKFRIVDGMDYALRVLQREAGFRYQRDEENHIIYI